METLIITEKPTVSQRIAQVLFEKPVKKKDGAVPYYVAKENGRVVKIASAAGHLYSLAPKSQRWAYPTFNIDWVPLNKVEKGKEYVGKYIEVLKKLSAGVDEFILATDWDIEGELLGYNALRFACGISEGKIKRMRFSTLTASELKDAYRNPAGIDRGLVSAGEARHIMDWYWGVNVSRALTIALKRTGRRDAIISAGRVQTPALALLVGREHQIESFVPEPYWEVCCELEIGGQVIKAQHKRGRFLEEAEARKAVENSKGRKAVVEEVSVERSRKPPLPPFDLGTLQREAFNLFRFSPKKTQSLAQTLYESGCISYPRTSSQKLPPGMNYRNIIENLSRALDFGNYTKIVLKRPALKPVQGKKTDPAHPAIYPTGQLPTKLTKESEKIYRLIVHRFLSLFGGPMVRESMQVGVKVGTEPYAFGGARTVEKGWTELYPYYRIKEVPPPELKKDDGLKILKTSSQKKKTQPPNRYNPASLVKEMENRGLGTKATRAETIDTLYRRAYIKGTSITATDLGKSVIEALGDHVPEIISEDLTRNFEKKLDEIQEGKESEEAVLSEARENLLRILREFKKKEKAIGGELEKAITKKNIIGRCPSCGGDLKLMHSRTSGKTFIGCSNYPGCRTSYSVPQRADIGEKLVKALSTEEESGDFSERLERAIEKIKSSENIGACPNCGKPLRIMRSRKTNKVFVGCTNYPRCSTSYPLPQRKKVVPTDKICKACGAPMIMIPFRGRMQQSCLNMNCPSKKKREKQKGAK